MARLVIGNHAGNAGEPPQEADQRRRTGKDDLGPAPSNQRRVAHELDHVTQTLLAVEDD